jgi:hypothetical protein
VLFRSFYALGGRPTRDIIATLAREAGVAVDVDEAAVVKEEAFLIQLDAILPIDPVVELVRRVHGRLPIAVVTGGYRRVCEQILASGHVERGYVGMALRASGPAEFGVLVAAVEAVVTSEFTSNTASANMVVPVVIALGQATGADPVMAALAATMAASLGFMMPVSTPCNALVYGSGRISLRSMMASGALLDVAGTVVIGVALLIVLWAGGFS